MVLLLHESDAIKIQHLIDGDVKLGTFGNVIKEFGLM